MKMLHKYIKSFSLGIQNSMEYRVNFFMSLFTAVFPIIIQFALWTAIFQSTGSQEVFGYTYRQMITYTVLAAVVAKLIITGFEGEIAGDIKEGGLNKYIVRPIGYLGYRASCFLGQKLLHFCISLIIIIILLIFLGSFLGFTVELPRIGYFILAIVLALLLNFTIFFCISTLAFWLTDVWGLFIGMAVVVNIISGGLIPLDILGPQVPAISRLLPFQYTIYFPVRIINGSLTLQESFQGLGIQCIWIVIIGAAAVLLWKKGMRKYTAIGG